MRFGRNLAAVITALMVVGMTFASGSSASALPRTDQGSVTYETERRTAARTGPGSRYDVHTRLSRGEVVQGTGRTHRRYTQIHLDDDYYWVASRDLTRRRTAPAETPSSEPAAPPTAAPPVTTPTPEAPAVPEPAPAVPAAPTTTPVAPTTTPAAPAPAPAAPTPTSPPAAPAGNGSWWKPAVGSSFQVQYTGQLNLGLDVDVYNLDHEGASKANIDQLRARGVDAICYFNAGGVEEWRADAGRFPASVIGQPLDGWPGENWLDIRQLDVLIPIMAARMDTCKAKGFVAIDPDNTDAYMQNTGFPITAQHQVAYQRALAEQAHKRGLGIGLKNNVEQIDQMAPFVDFAVNEQCYEYSECGAYTGFLASGKAVFNIEYGSSRAACNSRPNGMSTIFKDLELGAGRSSC